MIVRLALAYSRLQAEWLAGKIIAVTDGDTLTLLTDEKQQKKVRLLGIESPESNQAGT